MDSRLDYTIFLNLKRNILYNTGFSAQICVFKVRSQKAYHDGHKDNGHRVDIFVKLYFIK